MPRPRLGAGIAFDAARNVMVMFGGAAGDGAFLSDTWIRSCDRWTAVKGVVTPPSTDLVTLAYDAARRQVTLFAADGTTWRWDGASWMAQHPSRSPPRLYHPLLVDDPATGTLVLIGASLRATDSAVLLTWMWDGTTWTTEMRPRHAPPRRDLQAAAYDVASRRIVVFGGKASEADNLADTWTWDGADWIRLSPGATPPPGPANAAFDVTTGKVLLYAVADGSTWSWTGSTWMELHPSTRPSPRLFATMTSDGESNSLVLFGGKILAQRPGDTERVVNELWSWTNPDWQTL